MTSTKDKLVKQIDVDKEVLSILPKNNKKNLNAYKDKCNEIKLTYENDLLNLVLEIKSRSIKFESLKENPQIEEYEDELAKYNRLRVLNHYVTSFEKMELDQLLYVLRKFYDNNLDSIENSIISCLNKFKEVGIILTSNDFDYSSYTKEYMDALLKSQKDPSINLKETFENIYWKCPDIILHIEQNFRSIYLRHTKEIDKYYINIEKQVLSELEANSVEEAFEKYKELQNKYIECKSCDDLTILNKFLNEEYLVKDYEPVIIESIRRKLLNSGNADLNHLDEFENKFYKIENNNFEFNNNIVKLKDSLYEYKYYQTYKFILDKVKEIYNNEEKYDITYNQILKNIKKLESELFKLNKKLERRKKHKGILFKLFQGKKKKLESNNDDLNKLIIDLKQAYKDLEINKTYKIIKSSLKNDSTIYDALLLSSYFFTFLATELKNQFGEITIDEINQRINKFKEYLDYPNIILINNTSITQDKDLGLVIKDKYNLCNINLTTEDLDLNNIDKLMDSVNVLYNENNIRKSNLSFEDIKFYIQAKSILEKNDD